MNPDPAELPLRDIHAAAQLGWWPPAPGWWIVALIAVLLGIWVGRRMWFHYLTWRLKRDLKAEYAGILNHYESNRDGRMMLADSATFLRRLLVHIGKHQPQAGVVGETWADYLGAQFPGESAMQDLCRDLASSAYRPIEVQVETALLRDLVGRWIDCCAVECRVNA